MLAKLLHQYLYRNSPSAAFALPTARSASATVCAVFRASLAAREDLRRLAGLPVEASCELCQTSTMKHLAIIALLLGCTTTPGVVDKSRPHATATITTGTVSPAAGSELTKATVFSAEVTWSIENFQPTADYYIAPVFASKEGDRTTFSMVNDFQDNYRIPANSGSATIRYPVARELESPQLARPIRIWLYVMERTSAHTTRVIGRAGPFEYR